jgi:hypothetical protein
LSQFYLSIDCTIAGQNFNIVNQSLQRQTLLSVSKSMRKIGLTEIQKQTIAQHLREGIGQTKNQNYAYYSGHGILATTDI